VNKSTVPSTVSKDNSNNIARAPVKVRPSSRLDSLQEHNENNYENNTSKENISPRW